MHRLLAVSFAAALLIVGPDSAWAQRNTATFAGIVADTSGGILPGADVTLTNEGTSIVEQQVTNAVGEFVFNYVPPGSYTLTISITGFKTYTVKGISLGAAQTVRRRFELEVGALEESITVSGESPLINTASTEQRIVLESAELATLPTANRNITNLLNIGAGLTRQETSVEGAGSASASGGTIRMRLNGLGGAAMSITANGTDANPNAGTRTISSYNGISKIDLVSMESIGEVNIVKGIVPAEFGNALAGNLNVITKAGTNAWHGSLFERYEGAGLVAKPFFLKEKPESRWNQYGGSLGGPLLRDRAFFFTAFEKYRLDKVLELNANVPTPRLRDLLLTAMPFPETRALLAHYPLPTEPVSSPTALLGTFIGPGEKENTDDHLDTRADVRILGGNLSATFTYGHPFLSQESQFPGQPVVWNSTNRRVAVSYAFARDRWSSETRFGYNYAWLSRVNPFFNALDPVNPGPLDPAAKNRRPLPRINFPGLLSLGSEAHIRNLPKRPSYSFEQQVTLVTDKHAFKFGGLYAMPRGGRLNTNGASFSYLTEAEVVANRPSSASFDVRARAFGWSLTNWGLFVQDDWRVNTKLVVNMGVRYDFFGRFTTEPLDPDNPAGIVNLDGEPDPSFTFGPPRSPDRIYEDDAGANLGPRVGFAYNPDGNGNSVISGGWGMMFQSIDAQIHEPRVGMISGVPDRRSFTALEMATLGLRYPIYNEDMYQFLLATTTPGPLSSVVQIIDPHLQAPYAHVFTVGLQRALGRATVVNAAYLGTRGYRFRMYRAYNLPDRVTGRRPNPNLQGGSYLDDSGETRYHSLQATIRQRLTNKLQFNLNYTWSSTRANYDGDNAGPSTNDESDTAQDFFDTDASWGPALGDVTHNFIGDVIYELPGAGWSSLVARHLLGGWQIGAIFRARTGEPLTVTQSGRTAARPDVIDAANAINKDCCDIKSGNMQYLNPAAFQLVPLHPVSRQPIRAGNATVGQFRGPRFKNIDMSVGKLFNIGGQRRLELRADILNALNWVNYFAVSTSRSSSNFGQVTSTHAARVMQLQVRVTF